MKEISQCGKRRKFLKVDTQYILELIVTKIPRFVAKGEKTSVAGKVS